MIKKLTLLTGLLAGNLAYAVYPGHYIGIIGGETYTHYSASKVGLNSATVSNDGFGGGAFWGYQFNPNFAAEISFIQFASARFTEINGTSGSTSEATINEQALELFLKGTAPITNSGFNVTGKIGAAAVKAKTTQTFRDQASNAPDQSIITPAFGVGISYDVTPSFPIELSWTRLQSGGDIQNADLIGLSLSYFFS